MQGQLKKLRNGIHPKTGKTPPIAVELHVQNRATVEDATGGDNKGFYVYQPETFAAPKPSNSQDTAVRRQALLERIRAKEKANDDAKVMQGIQLPPTGMVAAGTNTTPDHGGGVWQYCFPDEVQHTVAMQIIRAPPAGTGGLDTLSANHV